MVFDCLVIIGIIAIVFAYFVAKIFFICQKICKLNNIKMSDLKKKKKDLKDEIETKIKGFGYDTKVYFVWLGSEKDGVFASLSCTGSVIIYSNWMKKLFSNEREWEISLYHSIGHELNHTKIKNNWCYPRTKNEKRFVNWLIECSCDLYGIEFTRYCFPKLSRDDILKAIKLKIDDIIVKKEKKRKKDKHTSSHPSWKYRYDIMKNNNEINEQVIRRIAEESEVEDPSFISEVIDLFNNSLVHSK